MIQNLHGFTDVHTVAGATQKIPGGQVASQESIKMLGTNGGGFFNVNSAHPFGRATSSPSPGWATASRAGSDLRSPRPIAA